VPTRFLILIGPIVAIVGLLILVFNRQVGAWTRSNLQGRLKIWDAVFETRPYQPNESGRVPILMVIAAGWVIIGAIFFVVGLTQP
jgi:hypothetical protein